MLYLNIRHRLPEIGLRTRIATLSTPIRQPEPHTDYVPPRSGLGYSQPTVEINSYPSRKSYGHLTMIDFARKYGGQGMSDIRETTSEHARDTWRIIDNAARKGRDVIVERAHARLSSEISKQRYIVAAHIPSPEMKAHPSELHGTPDPGRYETKIDASAETNGKFTRGTCETYLKDKGFVRMWTTEGHYDIYA